MMPTDILSELRAACLPFVTRSLRGHRRRIAWAAAVLLSLASVLGGLWMAQSTGARSLRADLRWEVPLHDREVRTYTVYADTQEEEQYLRQAVHRLASEGPTHGRLRRVVAAGCSGMVSFGYGGYADNAGPALAARAREAATSPLCQRDLGSVVVADNPDWAKLVLDRDLIPHVRRYASPLGLAATLAAIGMVGGALVGLGLLVLAPLLIGLQMAQEVHDNTLQPLTGTALTARNLAIGLASGPLAAIAIALSGPLVLWGIGAFASGHFASAVGSLAAVLAASVLLIVVAQLLAMVLGRQRSPGIVTIVLAAALGTLALTGIALALEGGRSTGGLVATLPGSASAFLWMRTFAPASNVAALGFHTPVARLAVGTCAMMILAALGTLVLERKILARSEGLLSRLEAVIATVVLSGMAIVAVPRYDHHFSELYLMSLFALVGPLQLVLMARVPVGSLPPKLRTIPLTRLLGEYAVALGIHLAMVAMVSTSNSPDLPSPGGVLHLGWALTVMALMTVRGTATPTSVAARLWFGIVFAAVFVELGIGASLLSSNHGDVFPMWHAPALAGLIYLGMLVWAPVSLTLGLTRSGAKVT